MFSIRSAYKLILDNDELPITDSWKSIWKWSGPNRIRHFLWIAKHGRLLTNSERRRRHMANDSSCSLCNHPEENLIHILTPRCEAPIALKPGPEDWITLNTDGAVNQTSRRAIAGGLLRNEVGHCLMAFSANLGNCSITRAEMRGAIIGLKIAWDLGFRRVELQLDSATAIALFSEEGNVTHHHSSEVLDFRELKGRDWVVSIRHTYREGNKAADHLASRGFSLPIGLHMIPTTDCNLGYFLCYDSLGISEVMNILIND
ncbi:Putative ribonuclease H protein At1g65750 [Linum perenne]